MPEIASIVYKPAGLGDDPESHYLRVPLTEAELVAGRGIRGDLKGTPNRPLNLMTVEMLAALASEGFKTGPGQMGEQIAFSGLDVDSLSAGDRVQLGDEAVLEMLKPRTGCDRFEHIQGHSPAMVQGRLGMMAKVVVGGKIRVGDLVKVLTATPA
jgi:MOSC domain-containing protein YiiM